MAERRAVAPRTFFLNETHEHSLLEQDGGGRIPAYTRINWATKGAGVARSLRAARRVIEQSPDPLRDTRLFLLSRPDMRVQKESKDRNVPGGRIDVETDFAGEHARTFERLDLDLIAVTENGEALVHAKVDALQRLEATAHRLAEAGKREKARWALLSEFHAPTIASRIDVAWLNRLDARKAQEVIVELQPVLTREDFDVVASSIRHVIGDDKHNEIVGAGRDNSGRRWLRARLTRDTIKEIASRFMSIQAIHAPMRSVALAAVGARQAAGTSPEPGPSGALLPAVATVDGGVPRAHPLLAGYRRGEYRHRDVTHTNPGDHGSRVASRIVFGEVDAGRSGFVPGPGTCRFLDVIVPTYPGEDGDVEFDDKQILEALDTAARDYPDVRVFNLSLGGRVPLSKLSDFDRQERYSELQSLDNFAFDRDVVIAVAAGNTPRGAIPNVDYPGHFADEDWGMAAWAAGFNTLVVGGDVPEENADGIARHKGWPSPFTRVGPGVANAAVPNFSASAGDSAEGYRWRPGQRLGVWTLNQNGNWEDAPGTSFAAPIVARDAAILLDALRERCAPGVQPFAATVKAFMWLVARPAVPRGTLPEGVRTLADRTLGMGRPRPARLRAALADTAVFIWQGTLERPGVAARVRLPIPREWLAEAKQPRLRVVSAWNTPVFAGAPKVWACRQVAIRLRATLDGPALRGRGSVPGAYPVIDRTYDLGAERLKLRKIGPLDSDEWVLEIEYQEAAPYPPTLRVEDWQRVALALELFDEDDARVSPQAAVQAMPLARSMVHLGGVKVPIWSPIKIPT